jgi:hypothetical protein
MALGEIPARGSSVESSFDENVRIFHEAQGYNSLLGRFVSRRRNFIRRRIFGEVHQEKNRIGLGLFLSPPRPHAFRKHVSSYKADLGRGNNGLRQENSYSWDLSVCRSRTWLGPTRKKENTELPKRDLGLAELADPGLALRPLPLDAYLPFCV